MYLSIILVIMCSFNSQDFRFDTMTFHLYFIVSKVISDGQEYQ